MSQIHVSATFWQAATLVTIDRNTSASVRFCAIETMAFGKSIQFTPLDYDFSNWRATNTRCPRNPRPTQYCKLICLDILLKGSHTQPDIGGQDTQARNVRPQDTAAVGSLTHTTDPAKGRPGPGKHRHTAARRASARASHARRSRNPVVVIRSESKWITPNQSGSKSVIAGRARSSPTLRTLSTEH